jgi:methylmalonyl-CoA/ethylmalonyl-CoA epimerase
LIEICFVTADYRRTMEGLVRLGIGPWRVYTFDSTTVTDRTYHGSSADYAIKVCFADVGDMAVEIMQPLRRFLPSPSGRKSPRHAEVLRPFASARAWTFTGRGAVPAVARR